MEHHLAQNPTGDVQIRADPAPEDIRRRMTLVFAAAFVILMGVATLEGFWPGGGPGAVVAIVLLIGCMLVVPVVMALLSRPLLRDIAALSRENARLRELYGRARQDSLLDGLTGLGNHRGFQEELARQLEHAGRTGSALALLLVDVDDLKRVNDEQGHAGGDRLLVAVGHIVMASLRRNDRAFRVGGDEFAILLPGADVDTGLTIARRLLAGALNGGDPSHPVEAFSLSIGVSAFPAPSNQGSLLYRHADAALYWCKRHGRTNAAAFDPGRHGIATDDRSIEDLTEVISTILADRMLRPVYQPIFSLETGRPVGYEGLIRPTDGAQIADASALFAAAERTDRTVELDFACLKAVADGVGELEPDVYLSVNLSPRTLESELFHPRELTSIFERRGIRPSQLVVELTEREEVH
ncbi:MAG TPA: diguanylate cyclase, partial [Candidatus Limnocylindrales bacterium]